MCHIKLIIGMAGTGKTYRLIKLYNNCESSDKLFLTYTNENAVRLNEMVPCETIHSHFKLNYVKKDYTKEGNRRLARSNKVDYIFIDEIGLVSNEIIKFLCNACYNLVGSIDYLQLLPINAKEHKLPFNISVEGNIFIIQQTLAHVSRLNLKLLRDAEATKLTKNRRFKNTCVLSYDNYKNQFINISETDKIKFPVLISKYKDVNEFTNVKGTAFEVSFIHNSGIRFLKTGESFSYETLNDNLIKIKYNSKINYISKNDFDKAKFTPSNLKIIHTTQGFEFDEGSIYLDSLFLPQMLYTAITRFKQPDKIVFVYKDIVKAKKIFEQQVEIFNNIKYIVDEIIN